MPAIIINGKAIAEKIHTQTAAKVTALKARGITPLLGVILVGSDPASVMYDKMKGAAAQKVGIEFILHQLPETISKTDLITEIKKLQTDHQLSGLIIQLPLPEHLYVPEVLDAIDPAIDVDFLTNTNMGKLIMNTADLLPPTPGAVITVLDEIGTDLKGKNVTIIGMGSLVGKPLAIMMTNAGASITTIDVNTRNVQAKCLGADIIVTGVGKKDLVRGDMVSPGTIVIDVGVSFTNQKVYGDVNREEVEAQASHLTPTPGGIGPITVARLLWNTACSAEKKS